jgi:hypothetical protein
MLKRSRYNAQENVYASADQLNWRLILKLRLVAGQETENLEQ